MSDLRMIRAEQEAHRKRLAELDGEELLERVAVLERNVAAIDTCMEGMRECLEKGSNKLELTRIKPLR